jgi:hypothetical protein
MAYTQRITWETLRSINSTSLTGAYQALGSPLAYPAILLKFVNNSTSLVTISIDGATDIDVLPANSFFLYDEDTSGNPAPESVAEGTQFFVKGAAGTGLIYLAVQHIVQTT